MMFKVKENNLPGNISAMFNESDGGYHLRGYCMFKQPLVRTAIKNM